MDGWLDAQLPHFPAGPHGDITLLLCLTPYVENGGHHTYHRVAERIKQVNILK